MVFVSGHCVYLTYHPMTSSTALVFPVEVVDPFDCRVPRLLSLETSSLRLFSPADQQGALPLAHTSVPLAAIHSLLSSPKDTCLYIELRGRPNIRIVFQSIEDKRKFSEAALVASPQLSLVQEQQDKTRVRSCKACKQRFGITKRAVTCGRCKGRFCRGCASCRIRLSDNSKEKNRVCQDCFTTLKSLRVREKFRELKFVPKEEELDENDSEPSKHTLSKSISRKVDMYGFRIPSQDEEDSSSINMPLPEIAAKWIASRTRLWDDYLTNHPDLELSRNSKHLKTLIRGGIPPKLRGSLWKQLSGAELYQRIYPANYYVLLVEHAAKLDPLTDPSLKQIEKDLKRTLPAHSCFDEQGGLEPLKNILAAYSVRNPLIGYCQSMNFIVGILLLFMEEEDAFWMLCIVVEQLACLCDFRGSEIFSPRAYQPSLYYYQKDLAGLQVDQSVFKALLSEKLPKIAAKLTVLDIEVAPMTTQWFLCLFVNTLPLELTLRVWDSMFFEGSKVLFRVALSIWKMSEKKILECSTFEQLHKCISNLTKSVNISTDAFISRMFDPIWFGSFPQEHLNQLRKKHETSFASRFGIRELHMRSELARTHVELFNDVLPDLAYKVEMVRKKSSGFSVRFSAKKLSKVISVGEKEVSEMIGKLKIKPDRSRRSLFEARSNPQNPVIMKIPQFESVNQSSVVEMQNISKEVQVNPRTDVDVKQEEITSSPASNERIDEVNCLIYLRRGSSESVLTRFTLDPHLETLFSLRKALETLKLIDTSGGFEYIFLDGEGKFVDISREKDVDLYGLLPNLIIQQVELISTDMDFERNLSAPHSKSSVSSSNVSDELNLSLSDSNSINLNATTTDHPANMLSTIDPRFASRFSTLFQRSISRNRCAAFENCRVYLESSPRDDTRVVEAREQGISIGSDESKMFAFGRTWHLKCFSCHSFDSRNPCFGKSLVGKNYFLQGDDLLCEDCHHLAST